MIGQSGPVFAFEGFVVFFVHITPVQGISSFLLVLGASSEVQLTVGFEQGNIRQRLGHIHVLADQVPVGEYVFAVGGGGEKLVHGQGQFLSLVDQHQPVPDIALMIRQAQQGSRPIPEKGPAPGFLRIGLPFPGF